MASHLDLEEQEQIAELKHFWNRWGNLITWVLIGAMGAFAAWNGWQYWQRQQAIQAAAMKDAVEQAISAKDWVLVERAAKDLREQFPKTHAASSTQLLLAKLALDQQKPEQAQESLKWVIEHASDPGLGAVARLRLAGMLLDDGKPDQALPLLTQSPPAPGFEPLFEDRLGDLAQQNGKPQEAVAHYTNAFKHAQVPDALKQVVSVKLAALGVDSDTLK